MRLEVMIVWQREREKRERERERERAEADAFERLHFGISTVRLVL